MNKPLVVIVLAISVLLSFAVSAHSAYPPGATCTPPSDSGYSFCVQPNGTWWDCRTAYGTVICVSQDDVGRCPAGGWVAGC